MMHTRSAGSKHENESMLKVSVLEGQTASNHSVSSDTSFLYYQQLRHEVGGINPIPKRGLSPVYALYR
jgi:hypothetical protein